MSMVAQQTDLFDRPARKRKVMMFASDLGNAPSGQPVGEFTCRRCGHQTGWMYVKNISDARRGRPCPNCNRVHA